MKEIEIKLQNADFGLYRVFANGKLFKGDLSAAEAKELKKELEKSDVEAINDLYNITY